MKKKVIQIIFVSLFFLVSNFSFAQLTEPGNGGGNPNSGGGTPVGGGAPIGSGLGVLIALGMAYTGKSIYSANFANEGDQI